MTKWCIDLLRKLDVQIAVPQRQRLGGHSENRPVVKFDRKSALGTAVMSTPAPFPGNFRLKCAADRRMVQTSAPLGWPNL
jgi:hypothetical protein